MHASVEQFKLVRNKVNDIIKEKQLNIDTKIVVVTKTFPLEKIMPILNFGHMHYGENKIQEAETKWLEIRKKYSKLQLHMIGKLQSNKAKKAVELFDYIHSLDNEKLARKLSLHQKELNKNIKIFIQVNLTNEKQKTGINLSNLDHFYKFCINELSLNIIGLMCLPPINEDSEKYFQRLNQSARKLHLKELSMGMSSDFEKAVLNKSTYIRLGTMILGKRSIK